MWGVTASPPSTPLALKNSLVLHFCSAFTSDEITFHRSFCGGLCTDHTAVQCRQSEWGLCFPHPAGCFEFMVPLWSLTSTLIPAGRVYLLFTACSGRSILCTYMLDLHRDRVFPNKIQMIDLVLVAFCPSVFLQPILLPHVFFHCYHVSTSYCSHRCL